MSWSLFFTNGLHSYLSFSTFCTQNFFYYAETLIHPGGKWIAGCL